MRTGVYGGVAVCCALLFVAGCAKEHVVKTEEPLAKPAPAAKPAEPAAPAPTAPAPPVESLPQQKSAGEPVESAGGKGTSAREAGEAGTASAQQLLDKIYFDYDSAGLSDTARATLKSNYDVLKKKSAARVEIEGHCDERGSDEYNLALGERRAKGAKNYLVTLGINPDRLSTISYGKEKPADQGHDEAAWAKNRRVEFVIVK